MLEEEGSSSKIPLLAVFLMRLFICLFFFQIFLFISVFVFISFFFFQKKKEIYKARPMLYYYVVKTQEKQLKNVMTFYMCLYLIGSSNFTQV